MKITSEVYPTHKLIFDQLSYVLVTYQGKRRSITSEYRCHHATLFGFICRLLGISLPLTRVMYMRCFLRDIFSAACRLNIIGPIDGARLQSEFSTVISDMFRTTNCQLVSSHLPLRYVSKEEFKPVMCYNTSPSENNHIGNKDSTALDLSGISFATAASCASNACSVTSNHNLNSSSITYTLLNYMSDINKNAFLSCESSFPVGHFGDCYDDGIGNCERTHVWPFEPATTAPVLELAQSQHEQLYSRLFLS